MSNFLKIAQDVYREGGISGSIISVTNQSGEAGRVVNWVRRAYQEICREDPLQWDFLRREVFYKLTPGKSIYSASDLEVENFAQWDISTARIASTQSRADETKLVTQSWKDFRNFWQFAANRSNTGRPINVSETPRMELAFGPIPSGDQWVTLEYIITPPELENDGDVPLLPARFHDAIMWRALRHYGMFESAPEVVMRADDALKEIELRLMIDQTPEVVIGGALC